MKLLFSAFLVFVSVQAQANTLGAGQKIMCETVVGSTLKIEVIAEDQATLTFSSQWLEPQPSLVADISRYYNFIVFSVSGLEMVFEKKEVYDGQAYHEVLESQNGYSCIL